MLRFSGRNARSALRWPGLLFLLLTAGNASARINSITLTPEHPGEGDTLRFEVTFGFGDACWDSALAAECQPMSGDTLSLDVVAKDRYVPGFLCPNESWEKTIVCEYGPLPKGPYVFIATQANDSIRWPGQETMPLEFSVGYSMPVQVRHWGAIRGMFR